MRLWYASSKFLINSKSQHPFLSLKKTAYGKAKLDVTCARFYRFHEKEDNYRFYLLFGGRFVFVYAPGRPFF